MWRAIVAVRHSGDEICPPEGGGLNLTLGKSTYYRIGMLYATGSIKIEKWNGTQWK
jgi:hypothetical protein